MSDQQPRPGAGEEPEPGPTGNQPPSEPSGAGGLPRYEGAAGPGGDYRTNPYGDASGAADPLAGMPRLGSLPRRLLARIIDSLIVGVPVSLIMLPVTGALDDGYDDAVTGGGGYLNQLAVLLVYFVYEGLMLTSRGQTLGKMAVKVRVGMLDNGAIPAGNPGWSRAAVYSLPQLVPCLGFLFWLVNVLFCTWDRPFRQCVHDKAAKTVVVSTA